MNDKMDMDGDMMGGERIGEMYPKARPKYANPATVGGGLQTLAKMAAQSGNVLSLRQGHHELTPNFSRRPMHPGHNPAFDRHMRPKLEGDEMITQPMY